MTEGSLGHLAPQNYRLRIVIVADSTLQSLLHRKGPHTGTWIKLTQSYIRNN